MSAFALRLPDSLHAHAKLLAEQDQASRNQFITAAVAEKVSAQQTSDFFSERARQSKSEALALFLQRAKARERLQTDEKA